MALRLQVLPWDFVWVPAAMTLVLSAAALIPATRALRLRIAEALAHV
jgi:ABC-type lipoprotein release transport system permease subunit